MYVRAISFCAKSDVSNEQALGVFHDLTAQMATLDGYRGATLAMSGDTRRGVALVYWTDADAAHVGGIKGLPVLLEQIHELVSESPDISGYEVLHYDVSGGA